MAIADMLGLGGNPLFKAIKPYGNTLAHAGLGLMSGKNWTQGFQNAAAGAIQGNQADIEAQKAAEEEQKNQAQINQTVEWMRTEGFDDLVQAAESGVPIGDLYQEAWRRKYQPPTEPTANMRDFQFAQQNPGYAEFLNPQEPPKLATDAATREQLATQYGLTGQDAQTFILTGDLPGGSSGQLSVTAQKELFEAEDAATAGSYVLSALDEAMSLNDSAYDGPTADIRGDATALIGNQEGIATSRLKNLTTELALSQLKTIFGAMPTEGERKILLELQGSVNQPRAVRAEIYKRAKEMAIRRIEDNKRKAAALRSGQYFEPGYGVMPPAPAGNVTSTGVQWSVDP